MNPVDDFLKTADWLGSFGRGLGRAATGALTAAAISGGAAGVSKGIDYMSQRFGKARDYKSMIQANPTLKKHDAGQVQMVYNSLRSQAPSMAKDPLIAGSFVRRTLEMSPESGPFIDPQTAKILAEAQNNISRARGNRGGIFDTVGQAAIPMAVEVAKANR